MDRSVEITHNGTTLPTQRNRKQHHQAIVWRNVMLFGYLHLAALYGVLLMFTSAKIATTIFAIFMYQVSSIGITAGAHRLWSHRAYKAKWPLRVILIIFNTIAFQNHVYEWARDHRLHHKYSETNADPHNANRGFFFSHVGWLLCRKHPEIMEKGRGIDMADLLADPIVSFQKNLDALVLKFEQLPHNYSPVFQALGLSSLTDRRVEANIRFFFKRYYKFLMPLLCFILPTILPVYCWGESWANSWFVATMFRYTFSLNVTWLVNSAAHMWGGRPYDRFINPSENITVALLALGEGWHNYHHVFPWDYKAAELGDYKLNMTTAFIDFFAKIGWAYDLKTVSADTVRRRVERTGLNGREGTQSSWGWDDKDLPQTEREAATIINKQG